MPFASGNKCFFPAAAFAAVLLLWKGGARGRLCVLMLALILWPGDTLICNTIKHAVARPRPSLTLPGVNLPMDKRKHNGPVAVDMSSANNSAPTSAGHNSMPSSHAANWFAATMIFFVYYRRSAWVLLPLACLVSFSRVYNGVHYPSDVLAGAILGAGYAVAGLWAFDAMWQLAGRKWFPLWWEKMPSLLNAECRTQNAGAETQDAKLKTQNLPGPPPAARHSSLEAHWLRLGYVVIAVLLFARLAYIGSGIIELSEDEAYQWTWSKHLALSYYSKPPLIAYTQWLGTHLFGDNAFGVRFFPPVIASVLGLMLLRFFAREVNARAGFFLLLIVTATPLLSVGAILMTVDPLSVLFWTAAMFAGWRAVQPDGKTRDWFRVGLWMGLGFLSKYTELFQWFSWIVFFVLWKPARSHLRRPGPYLGLFVNLICMVPVLIWNYQHQWVTLSHVAGNARLADRWKPTVKYLFDFLSSETGLLNPVFFIAAIWAAIAFWRRDRHNPRLVYFFSMGAPLFLAYLLFTFHSRVLPNWIAPSVLPLFCLMVIYWDARFRTGNSARAGWSRAIKCFLAVGLGLGLTVVTAGHDTDLVGRIIGHPLPAKLDPLRRVRGWKEAGRIAGEVRQELLAEGKPVFIIGPNYGVTGELAFYLPDAPKSASEKPLVYHLTMETPGSQFYFYPGYLNRKGENALFVHDLSVSNPRPEPAPAQLKKEFTTVTDLGVREVRYHNIVIRQIQLFACRDLR